MKVNKSLPVLNGSPDILFRATSIACQGECDSARTRDDATAVLGMRPQVALYHCERRVAPTQMEQHDCHLVIPVWRVGLRVYLAEDSQGVVIMPLIRACLGDASQGVVLAGRDRERLLKLDNPFVEHADVQVDIPQMLVRPIHVRVEPQRAQILLDCALVEKVVGRSPKQAGLSLVRLCKIRVEPKRFFSGHLGSLQRRRDRKSTRLNSSHEWISYAVFCLK